MFDKKSPVSIWLIWFVVTLIASSASIMPFLYYYEEARQKTFKVRESAKLGLAVMEIKTVFAERLGDIRAMSKTPYLLEFDQTADSHIYSEVIQVFKAFCSAYGVYDQIRLIDSNGHESIRVNFSDQKCEEVPPTRLQNKAGRYYFTQARRLNQGDIYVSPMDLNVEGSVIEKPYKPVIRYSTPIIDDNGDFQGALVMNYLANHMLKKIFFDQHSLMKNYDYTNFLVNGDSYYLASTDPTIQTFGFMFNHEKDRFAVDFPEVWNALMNGSAVTETDEGLFLMRKVSVPVASEDSENSNAESNSSWYVIHKISPENFYRTSILYGSGRWVWLGFHLLFVVIVSSLLADRTRSSRELRFAMKRAEQLSITDHLTGLFNRLYFENVIDNEIKRSIRYRRPLSVILFDIDHFKSVNDTYGHLVGDEVLKAIATIMKENIRAVDKAVRFGGEEFLVICPEVDASGAAFLAEKLRSAIESFDFPIVGSKTSSFGVSEFIAGDDEDSLTRRADEALYKAKNSGRNRVVIG